MLLNTRFRTAALISSLSSLIQGLTLCVLAILGCLAYTCSLPVGVPADPEQLTFKHYLAAYFQGNSCQAELLKLYPDFDQATSSQKLLLLNIFIFAFNFFQTFASSMLMFALWTKKIHLAFGWTLFYLMMCYCVALIDLVAMSIISLDYSAVSNSSNLQGRSLAMLTLLTLIFVAGRGFYIWVANFAFTIYLSVCLCKDAGCGKRRELDRRGSTAPTFREAVRCPNCNPSPAFQFNQSDVDKPTTFEKRPTTYPSHTAFSRWPQLAPENKAAPSASGSGRPHSFPGPYPPPPPVHAPKLPSNVAQRLANGSANSSPAVRRSPRPGSLEEAIKTVRPLRTVNRPGLALQPDSNA